MHFGSILPLPGFSTWTLESIRVLVRIHAQSMIYLQIRLYWWKKILNMLTQILAQNQVFIDDLAINHGPAHGGRSILCRPVNYLSKGFPQAPKTGLIIHRSSTSWPDARQKEFNMFSQYFKQQRIGSNSDTREVGSASG